MKVIFLMIFFFSQMDIAYAEEQIPKAELEQTIKELHVFSLRLPARDLHAESFLNLEVDASHLESCQVEFKYYRDKQQINYNCNALKNLKTETLNIAVNE